MATVSGKRAFWMHQAVEYIIGAAFVAQGLQSPTPVVPAICGGLVMLNTACAKGPLSAFRVFGRRMHRLLDLVVIGVVIVGAVQPVLEVDTSVRLVMAVLAFVLAFIWVQSDFNESPRELRKQAAAEEKLAAGAAASGPAGGDAATNGAAGGGGAGASRPRPATAPDGTTADAIGRTAGRLAGRGVNIYREQAAKRRKK